MLGYTTSAERIQCMTTRDLSKPAEESVEDEVFDVPDDQKPKTRRELYEALVANGFIGA